MTMESAGAPQTSFIETYNKNTYKDESYRSQSSDDDDADDNEFDSFDDSSHQLDAGGEQFGNGVNGNGNSGGNHGRCDETRQIQDLARRETNSMRAWRVMVLLLIMVTCATVTTGTFLFLRNGEKDAAEDNYALFTRTVTDASHRQFRDFLIAMEYLAQTVTAAGIVTSTTGESSFPFVRVPLFEVPAGQTREVSGVELLTWNPLVTEAQRNNWSAFVVAEQGWYKESKEILLGATTEAAAASSSLNDPLQQPPSYDSNSTLRDFIWRGVQGGEDEAVPPPGPFAPIWHCSPPPFSPRFINYNMLSEDYVATMLPHLIQSRDGLMSAVNPTLSRLAGLAVDPRDHEADHDQYVESSVNKNNNLSSSAFDHPHSVHLQPVFERLHDRGSKMVGFLAALVPWDRFLANLLPDGVNGITAVLKNTCDQSFTYVLDGKKAKYMGSGDLHDAKHENTKVVVPLASYGYNETTSISGHCVYSVSLYLSNSFEYDSGTSLATICTVAVAIIFMIMAGAFCMYDHFVRRRNDKVVTLAARSNAIISSLFPTQVRDRLFAEKEDQKVAAKGSAAPKSKLKSMMNSGDFATANVEDDSDFMYKTKPIADLFPETTILFADISGFTAWSSVREPTQVFILLETLYRAFDDIAKKRRVFKVETIGDCYVAVTGLPDPRKDHAVAMARFSRDCMIRTRSLVKKLEVTLGPDTGDLAMRMGMHSGPVTAGVLRGERSRFQLFGDTMNTAARMEHNGLRDKIQLSQETADLLIAAGKANWLSQREDVIHAKGKGEMQTYWLEISSRGDSSSVLDASSSNAGSELGGEREDHVPAMAGMYDAKTVRLIEWNLDVLLRLLKQIVARRKACPLPSSELVSPNEAHFTSDNALNTLDEVKEIILLPKFKDVKYDEDPEDVLLDPLVVQQLHEYVSNIAALYQENPFHNFEHASHVTMSVVKLLSRIVAPHVLDDDDDDDDDADESLRGKTIASTLHDHTYGITSDPLTQFSCVLSALIHDVDHSGVPNAQLVNEHAEIAKQYQNKSVAEQNSVDLAWNLLMDDDYTQLRRAIYETDGELKRFRQLVVNSVMATDIVDKELKALRNLRWDRAFSHVTQSLDNRDTVNRKATIVIEHLIQASDVAHTMQHWHIYRKWNERFFIECYQAYVDGRAEKNPADGWYEGEIGFFDFYIIPLAKKLKDCGVFGVSSDEYLNYAIRNRQEWETRGREVVDEMVELVNEKLRGRGSAPTQATIPPVQDEDSARQALVATHGEL